MNLKQKIHYKHYSHLHVTTLVELYHIKYFLFILLTSFRPRLRSLGTQTKSFLCAILVYVGETIQTWAKPISKYFYDQIPFTIILQIEFISLKHLRCLVT